MPEAFQAGFVRQRRSLILLSIALSVVVWLGIHGSEVRLGPGGGTGMTVDLADRRYVYWAMYVVWFWFLIRYIQYFLQVRPAALKGLRDFQQPEVARKAAPILDEKAKKNLELEVLKKHPKATNVQILDVRGSGGAKRTGWTSISSRFHATTSIAIKSRQTGAGNVSTIAKIEGLELKWFLFRTTALPTLRHPYVSEYILPLFIAAIPLLMLIFRWGEILYKSAA